MHVGRRKITKLPLAMQPADSDSPKSGCRSHRILISLSPNDGSGGQITELRGALRLVGNGRSSAAFGRIRAYRLIELCKPARIDFPST